MHRLIAIILFAVSSAGHAGSIDKLKSFVAQTRSVKADFVQTVLDKNGKALSDSKGTLRMSRPGKFRWEYVAPYAQLIVGDGQKLWLWDPDLNQATVRTLDEAIGSSPAALLAGNDAIEQNFALKDGGQQGRLAWLEATPKSADVSFEKIRMGFNAKTLDTMELTDTFGQTTIIRFSKIEPNLQFSPEVFKFVPPPGADVVGDQP